MNGFELVDLPCASSLMWLYHKPFKSESSQTHPKFYQF